MKSLLKGLSIFAIALVLCNWGSASGGIGLNEVPSIGRWYLQQAKTEKFRFYIKVEGDGENGYAIHSIRIVDRKNKEIMQVIRDIDAMKTQRNPSDLVTAVDANFDGLPDFLIPFSDGGVGPNSSNNYYIFNPKNNQFEINQQLSELPQSAVNANGTISSSYRDGCCHHHSETYRFLGGKLILVSDWDEAYTADGWIETTVRELVGGKWRSKTTRTKRKDEVN